MANIAKITIQVAANTGKFIGKMKRAGSVVERFGKRVLRAGRSLKLFGAAVLGIGGAGLGVMILQTRQAVDRTAKLADELGLNIKVLQEYQLLAKLTGTNVQTMHRSMQILNRRVGEAIRGTGEGAKAFEAMGLRASDLAEMGLEGTVEAIAASVHGLGSQAEKAGFLFQTMSRQGVEMANFMQGIIDSLEAIRQKNEALGLFVTSEEADQIENMNDQFEFLKSALSTASQIFLAELAPAITGATNSALDFIERAGGIRVITLMIREGLIKAFVFVKMAIQDVIAIVRAFAGLLGRLKDVIMVDIIGTIREVPGVIRDAWEVVKQSTSDLAAFMKEKLLGGLNKIKEGIGKFATTVGSILFSPQQKNQMRKMLKELKHDFKTLGNTKVGKVVKGTFNGMTKGAKGAAVAVGKAAKNVAKMAGNMAGKGAMKALGAAKFAARVSPIGTAMTALTVAGAVFDKEFRGDLMDVIQRDRMTEFADGVIGAKDALNDLAASSEAVFTRTQGAPLIDHENLNKLKDAAISLFKSTRTPFENFVAEIERLNDLYDMGRINSDLYSRGVDQATMKLDKATRATKKLNDENTTLGEFMVAKGGFRSIDFNSAARRQQTALKKQAAHRKAASESNVQAQTIGFRNMVLGQIGRGPNSPRFNEAQRRAFVDDKANRDRHNLLERIADNTSVMVQGGISAEALAG